MFRVASDVGGTFTDLIGYDDSSGELRVAKTLTTPEDQSEGLLAALAQADCTPAEVDVLLHGSTVVINALLERKGVPTALVTTAGFRDVLEIGRGNRPDLYNLRFHSPAPFVARRLRFEVAERIGADGGVVEPLDESGLAAVAEACRAAGVEAVAVALLNAYANPVHEARVAASLRDALPAVSVTAATEITREWREYERTNTAVLNAYVQPPVERYLGRLEGRLREGGFEGHPLAMQSNAGTTSFEQARRLPIALIESGPAGGINGAEVIAADLGEKSLLYVDIGGTTAKTSLVVDGRAKLTSDYRLERSRTFPGYPVRASILDVVEIGAGGGSIAWLDRGRLLRVGPQSAGAAPGPACYGLGGTAATLTDANLWTGRIGGGAFSRNALHLDMAAAERALADLGGALDLDVDATALAIIRLAEAAMIEALKLVSIQRGHDPRDFVLLASGGGGPVHGAALGRELGVRELLIPPYPGIFCAWGMLASAPHQEFVRSDLQPVPVIDDDFLRDGFAALEAEAVGYFEASGLGEAGTLIFERRCDLRYQGQEHTVTVEMPTPLTIASMIEAFHAAHERAYTFSLADTPAELVSFRLLARADVERPRLQELAAGPAEGEAEQSRRPVLFDDGVRHETPVLARAALREGFAIDGPAIVEEPTSTTVVHPGQRLTVDRYGILHIGEG